MILNIAKELKDEKTLLRRFTLRTKKNRKVNDAIPVLKDELQAFNIVLSRHYEARLQESDCSLIAHAYRPAKSIVTNAKMHKQCETIIKFDFSHFYDDVRYEYFEKELEALMPELKGSAENRRLVKRLFIDPQTNGVTQGLCVSGTLAGLALIPFWQALTKALPETIVFTQYSDDLIFSYVGKKRPEIFTEEALTQRIQEALISSNRRFTLNDEKTKTASHQFRKITGVRINENNQMTPSRKDYRWFRLFSNQLRKGEDFNELLSKYHIPSKEAFIGKVSYWRMIDETGKIDKVLNRYSYEYLANDCFRTWLLSSNPFD